jgi:hypothetical protein
MVNKQAFGFRKPTAEIMKNKLINLILCLRCSVPKCLSSIMCFSVWYYYTSKLSNFDFTNEKIQTNLIQPHQYMHFCSWLFFVEYIKFYMHDYDTKLQNTNIKCSMTTILYEYNVQYIDFFTIYQLQSKHYTIYIPKYFFSDFNSGS